MPVIFSHPVNLHSRQFAFPSIWDFPSNSVNGRSTSRPSEKFLWKNLLLRNVKVSSHIFQVPAEDSECFIHDEIFGLSKQCETGTREM